ncbi:MAG: hypothetical protein IKU86_06975, partial [Thermoguttaceae bacterium]|nr:hypothetical protein [Thermoguttaceae bacterium]
MNKFPNGAVILILASATVAFASLSSTFAQTPVDDASELVLPAGPNAETLVAETVVETVVDDSTLVPDDLGVEADAAIRQLIAGNARYLKAGSDAADALPRLARGAESFPIATILYASDMPVKPDALTQTTDRDVYMTPIKAGAVAADDLAAVEYGVLNLRTPLLVVFGHYPSRDVSNLVRNFDALEKRAQAEAAKVSANQRLATDDSVPDDLKTYNLVGPAVARAKEAYPDLQGYELANVVSEAIVWQSLETILLKSAAVQDLVRAGRLDVVAAIVDDKTGRVYWLGQHPLQEEFVKPLPNEYVLDDSAAATDAGIAILSDDDLPAPLDDEAIQVYVERYENNAYYADYVDEYYRVPVYYEPSWELFASRAWTYRPWSGVWVESFVPWPRYYPWGPPPGAAPEFGFSYFNGRLNFFIGFNRRPTGPRYVDPRFRPRDPWWGPDFFVNPPRDPIFELIFGGRGREIPFVPFDKRPGYRPGPPRPTPPASPAWRPGGVRPNDRPGYRPGSPAPGVAPPGYRPGAPAPGIDSPGRRPNNNPGNRPGNRPEIDRPTVRPGGLTPLLGDRPGGLRPNGPNSNPRPGGLTPIPATRPGIDAVRPGNRPGADAVRPGGRPGNPPGNRPGADANRPSGNRPQIAERPANRPAFE